MKKLINMIKNFFSSRESRICQKYNLYKSLTSSGKVYACKDANFLVQHENMRNLDELEKWLDMKLQHQM